MSPAISGLIAGLGALIFVGVIPLSGKALDRIGARAVLGIGTLAASLGLAIFGYGYAMLPVAIVAMVIAGVGFGTLLGAPTRYLVSQAAPVEMRTTAIGLLSIFLIIGQLIGTSLAGGLIGPHALHQGRYTVMYTAFALIALLSYLGTRWLPGPQSSRP